MPKVSIGLPVYNGERFLRIAVDSVLRQTMPDFELHICDNCSTDATEAICRDYAHQDNRVHYYRNRLNLGAAANFRAVFELAQATYFRWLAADDYMGPTSLERCQAVLDTRSDVVLCTTQADIVDAQGRLLRHYNECQAIEHDSAYARYVTARSQDPWCIAVYGLMRREIIARISPMGSYAGSDTVFLAELSMHGKFAELPERLFFRRFHDMAYSFDTLPNAVHASMHSELCEERHPAATHERIRTFYTPGKSSRASLTLYTWRILYEHGCAIQRGPLSLIERGKLWLYLLRNIWWSKATLSRELIDFGATLLASTHDHQSHRRAQ